MPNLSWLAALGSGLNSAGSSMETNAMAQQALRAQRAKDALQELLTLQQVGGHALAAGMSGTQAVAGRTVADLGNAPGLTATAAAIPGFQPAANAVNDNPANPLAFGNPRTIQLPRPDGTMATILLDPSQTPAAQQERRLMRQQDLMTQRQEAHDRAAAKQAQDLAELQARLRGDPTQLVRDKNGQYVPVNPKTGLGPDGKPVEGYTPPQQPTYSIQTTQGPDGQPIITGVNTHNPADVVQTGLAKAATGGAGGGLSGLTMQTMARMGTSFNDLSQAVDQMDRMENDPAFRAKLTAYNKALMAGAEAQPNAEAHGIGGMLSNMAGQLASGKAQQSLDPDLNTYLNLKQRVGTAFTELLPRPNQQLLQIEKGLSGIDVGWNPELLKGIQARRQGGLNVLKNILSHQGMLDEKGQVSGTPMGGRGAGGGAPRQSAPPTAEQSLWDAAVAKYGKQKVLQEYGPRPGGE